MRLNSASKEAHNSRITQNATPLSWNSIISKGQQKQSSFLKTIKVHSYLQQIPSDVNDCCYFKLKIVGKH